MINMNMTSSKNKSIVKQTRIEFVKFCFRVSMIFDRV